MKRVLVAIAALAMLVQPAIAEEQAAPDEVVEFSDQDAAMNAAIENARSTLPQFFAEFDAAPAQSRGAFTVKVGMPVEGGGHEHIWVDNLRREGNQLIGALANEPNYMPGMHRGSRVVIDQALISDWSIHAPEGLYGSYTTRVMLPYLDPGEAAQLRQMLTPSPTPAEWST
jgi:uncharacterized protein YegJ (DUF2314 family)